MKVLPRRSSVCLIEWQAVVHPFHLLSLRIRIHDASNSPPPSYCPDAGNVHTDPSTSALLLLRIPQVAVRQMLSQPMDPESGLRGRVINISSQHGMVACPGDLAYGAGKAVAVLVMRPSCMQRICRIMRVIVLCVTITPCKASAPLCCRPPTTMPLHSLV